MKKRIFLRSDWATRITHFYHLQNNRKIKELRDIIDKSRDYEIKILNFKGMKAEDASRLFVELSTNAGYLQYDTTGTEIKIDIMSDKTAEEKQAIKNAVVEKVHSYLDENGIIACAVVDLEKSLSQAIENLGYSASELLNKTNEQLL